jgi:hypothetical protein
MPSKPSDQEVINTREKLISSDFNAISSQEGRILRELLQHFTAPVYPQSGGWPEGYPTYLRCPGDGLRVYPSIHGTPLAVSVHPGVGFYYWPSTDANNVSIGGVSGLDDRSPYRLLYLSDYQTLVVPSTSFVGRRVDIIEARYRNDLTDLASRDVATLAPDGSLIGFTPQLVAKTLTKDLLGQIGQVNAPNDSIACLSYKVGVVNPVGPGAVPAGTAGYATLSEVWILGGSTPTITVRHIADRRHEISQAGIHRASFVISKAGNTGAFAPGTLVSTHSPPGVWILNNDAGSPPANNVGAWTAWVVLVPGHYVSSFRVSVQCLSALLDDATGAPPPPYPQYTHVTTAQVRQYPILAPTQGSAPASDGPYGCYGLPFELKTMVYQSGGAMFGNAGIQNADGDIDPVIYGVEVEWRD